MGFYAKVVQTTHRAMFKQASARVVHTQPVKLDKDSGLAVLSQTYDKDVYAYLVAAKTFAQHISPAVFIVVDDNLSVSNKSLISHHLGNVRFLPCKLVPNSHCPAGGTWERILSIADVSKDYYVVQLDSDTVTLQNPEHVVHAINQGVSFTLSTKMGRHFISTQATQTQALGFDSQHVQVLAERVLYNVPELSTQRYIRGCSGFAGFARGSLSRDAIERFSMLMQAQLGKECWARWGTEQFTSNYFIANTENAVALPFEQYPYWAPGTDLAPSQLVHFIGDNRFTSAKYARVTAKAIQTL